MTPPDRGHGTRCWPGVHGTAPSRPAISRNSELTTLQMTGRETAAPSHPRGPMRTMRSEGGRAIVGAGLLTLVLAYPGPRGRATANASELASSHYVHTVEAALNRGDVGAADQVAQQAYAAARGSQSWESMVAAGDAYRRLAAVSSRRPHALGKARGVYLEGLFGARQQQSLPGVFQVAEAFAALGDRDLVNTSLRIAETVAARVADPQAREQARASVERLARRLLA